MFFFFKLLCGFVKVVQCFSRPLPNKTKLKFDPRFQSLLKDKIFPFPHIFHIFQGEMTEYFHFQNTRTISKYCIDLYHGVIFWPQVDSTKLTPEAWSNQSTFAELIRVFQSLRKVDADDWEYFKEVPIVLIAIYSNLVNPHVHTVQNMYGKGGIESARPGYEDLVTLSTPWKNVSFDDQFSGSLSTIVPLP